MQHESAMSGELRQFAWPLLVLTATLAQGCGLTEPPLEAPGVRTPISSMVTRNTVRISGENPFAASAAITQLTYTARGTSDRPAAVTLVRVDGKAAALLAAARLSAVAPVLFVEAERIPPETRAELKRLAPRGNRHDGGAQVYLVGSIDEAVQREVEEILGFRTRVFRSDDPHHLAELLDTWAAQLRGGHPDEVIIVQLAMIETALPAAAWSARSGDALLFVEGDAVPEPTRRALARRPAGKAFVYLLGDPPVISEGVQQEMSRYGHVQRIGGRDAVEISLAFASYRDRGESGGYWLETAPREFGWSAAEAGHDFTIANPRDWPQAVTGSLLSTLGSHGPMILVDRIVDERQRAYFERVRPSWSSARHQVYNHGWILGDVAAIPWETQVDLDRLLEPR